MTDDVRLLTYPHALPAVDPLDESTIRSRLHRFHNLTEQQIDGLVLFLDPAVVDAISDEELAAMVTGMLPNQPLQPGGGMPLGLPGAQTLTRYAGGTDSGAPTLGAFHAGDFVIAADGHVFVCIEAGTPGTWVDTALADIVASTPDATTSTKGLIRLAGDLAGTASSPTVPGLASKADSTATVLALAGKQATANPTAVKSAAYTAAENDLIPVDTTGGAVTITLPATPADKTRVTVKHVIQGGSNAVTITAGGSNVFNKTGGSTSLTLATLNQAMTLQYQATSGIWYVVNDSLTPTGVQALLNGTFVPKNDLSSFKVYIPEQFGAASSNDTSIVAQALAAAIAAGGQLRFLDRNYTTDMVDVTSAVKIQLGPGTVLKLKDSATESSGVLCPLRIRSSNVSVLGGTIDANRAGQSKSAYNTAGGAGAKQWYGVYVQGTVGSPLSGVSVRTKVINATDFGVGVYATSRFDLDVQVESSGAGVSMGYSTDGEIRSVALYDLDANAAKNYPHAFDLTVCDRMRVGRLVSTGQMGDDSTGAGTSLSNYLSGITAIGCSSIDFGSIYMEPKNDPTANISLGLSFLACKKMTVEKAEMVGWTDGGWELGGVTDSSFSNVTVDGGYRTATGQAGRGISLYNNGYYATFASRSQRYTSGCQFTNVEIKRCLGAGLYTSATRGCTFTNVRSHANRYGLQSLYLPVNASDNVATQYIRDIEAHRYIGCDFSYNELYGVQAQDLKNSAFVDCRASNNGQANNYPGGARLDGGTVTDAAGITFPTSTTGSPLAKTGLRFIDPQADDEQIWTDAVSALSTNPAVLSVASEGLYRLGQTIKLTGAGAAAADLYTRIIDVDRDEITVSPAPSTFPTVAGTGTLTSSGTALTGSGTAFLSELKGRYWITAGGETHQVVKIASNTSATLDTAFAAPLSGATFTIQKITSAGIPSQKHGLKFGNDTTSPRIYGGSFTGNITAAVTDGTTGTSATKVRYYGVPGQAMVHINTIASEGQVRAQDGTGTQVAMGGLGPSSQAAVQFVSDASATLYRSTTATLRTPGMLVADGGVVSAYISGAGKTSVSDADFPNAPGNGIVVVVQNTTDSTTRIAVKGGSAWKISAALT